MLEVERVEAQDARDAAAVLLIVGHHALVAEDALDLHRRESAVGEQSSELRGGVFAHVPRVARERHGGVGRGEDQHAARPQHAPGLGDEERVALDVFDHLERHHAVERAVGEGQGRHGRAAELHPRAVEQPGRGCMLVERDEPLGAGGEHLDAVARPGADLQHVARDAPGRRVVGQQRALEYEVVRRVARYALGRCDLSHVSIRSA